MHRWFGPRIAMAAATAALAAGGASVLAQEAPKTVSLRTPDRWKTGETFTVTDSETIDLDITMSAPGAQPETLKGSTRAECTAIWRCVEASEDGTPKRAHVWIKSWAMTPPSGEKDESAAGSFVEVTPGNWATLAAPTQWSAEATAWFARRLRFGSRLGGVSLEELDLPEALPVGETLRFPGEKTGMALGSTVPPGLDVSKLEMTLRVDSAEPTPRGTLATIAVGMSGAFGGQFPVGRDALTTVGEGSHAKGSGKGRLLVGASHLEQHFTLDSEVTMLLSSDGHKGESRVTAHAETRHVPGGDMPEVPKAGSVASEHGRQLDALLAECAAVDIHDEAALQRMVERIDATQETLWGKSTHRSDIVAWRAKYIVCLEWEKKRRLLWARLGTLEDRLADVANLAADEFASVRRELEEMQGRTGADKELGERVRAARTRADRAFISRLAADAKAVETSGPSELRRALPMYARAEDECKKLLDPALHAKDADAEGWLKQMYRTLVGESDRIAQQVFTRDVVDSAPWTDCLSGERAGQWNAARVKGFRAEVEDGALVLVGPDVDANKLGLVSIGDREQWRSFLAEVEFTVESGGFDFFLHLGRSPTPITPVLNIATTGAMQNVRAGEPTRVRFSIIGNKLTFRLLFDGAPDPVIVDLKWTAPRKGAIGILVPPGTKARFTKFQVKDLR